MEFYYVEYIFLFMLIGVLLSGRLIPNLNETVRLDVAYRSRLLSTGLVLFLLAIGVVAGSREISFGTDFHSYYDFYEGIYETKQLFPTGALDTEPGWTHLNFVFATLGVSPGVFFGLLATATWLIFSLASTSFRQLLPLMFFFIFSTGLFYESLNTLRQSLAIAIYFYSTRFIIQRNPVLFLAAICVAATIHNSILVMIPSYFMNRLPYYRNVSIVAVTASLALSGLLDLTSIMGTLTSFVGSFDVFSKYGYYLNNEAYSGFRPEGGTYAGFWLKGVFSVWIAWCAQRVIRQRPEFAVYANLFVIFAVLNNLFLSVELIGRLLAYPALGWYVMAAAVTYTSSTYDEKAISHVFLFAFVLLFLASTHSFITASMS